jgi:hypothetical protein
MTPIFNVKVNMSISKIFEIEAKDGDTAQEKAEADFFDEMDSDITFEGTESEVDLSDNQYTDQQELEDRERDHGL